jgi:hypothetical protein
VVGVGEGGVGDLNGDGFLDVQFNNVSWLNNGNDNHWLRINTVGTASNTNGIGARVEITSALGTQIRDVVSGDGFRYMSSLIAHFGLGADTVVSQITVYWPSGTVNTITDPPIDTVLTITEELNTGMAAHVSPTLSVYPVPATNVLYVNGTSSDALIRVLDITGKKVLQDNLLHGQLDVSALPTGVYVLEVSAQGRVVKQKFIKGAN